MIGTRNRTWVAGRALHLGVACAVLAAQALALDPHVLPSQYRSTSWSVRDGLPQSSVLALARDPRGYLWVGTQAGLARFDGTSFTVFDDLSDPALPGCAVLSLLAGGDGLWIGTASGLFLMRDGRIRTIRLPGAAPDENVRALAGRPGGGVLAGTGSGRLYEVRGDGATLAGVLPLPRDRQGLNTVLRWPDGELWIGTGQGLWRRDALGAVPLRWQGDGGPALSVFSMVRTGEQTALVATEGGLFTVERDGPAVRVRREALPGLGAAMVRCVAQDRDGTLWAGTLGAGVYRGTGAGWQHLSVSRWPGLRSVRCLLADGEGLLWLGSFEHGLHRFAPSAFLNFGAAEGVPAGAVRSVAFGANGDLWVGSGGGLSLIRNGKVIRPSLPEDVHRRDVVAVLVSGDGSLWAGTQDEGVLRIGRSGVERWGADEGIPRGQAAVLFEDRTGTVWVGTDGGAARFRGGVWEPFSIAEGLPSNVVTAMAQGPDGTMVVGTMKGLARLDGRRFVLWPLDIPPGPVSALWFDGEGDLWVGVEGHGVSLVTAAGIHTLARPQGFPIRTVGAMAEGPGGRLWLAGVPGILAVAWRPLKRALLHNGELPPFYVATEGDGLRTVECSIAAQPAMAMSEGGTLCFATVDGVSCLKGGVPPPRAAPGRPMVLESLLVDGAPVPMAGDLRFHAGLRSLELHFTSLALATPEERTFQVWLEGLEDGWRPVATAHKVRYTHLPPGSFVLHVRSTGLDGRTVGDTASLPFTVEPPPWQRPWVLLLAAMVLLGAGPAVYYTRVTALERRSAQLAAMVEERTEELRRAASVLERMTREDPLTAIPNHRAFEEKLDQAWRGAARQRQPVTLIMADIDHFKELNDAFGHLHGDECLRRVAAALTGCIHRPDDLVARYGGEEFVALLPTTGLEGGLQLAEAMRRAVEELRIAVPRPDGHPWVTVSFGVAVAVPSGDRSESLIHAADRALYRAKRAGRNRVEAANLSLEESTAQYPALEEEAAG